MAFCIKRKILQGHLRIRHHWSHHVPCGILVPQPGMEPMPGTHAMEPIAVEAQSKPPDYQEFFSKKSDCSLFMFGSHNKKRPNNLVIGRMYDYHVLDMIELGIEKFVSLKDIKNSKCPEGTKPMLIFAGDDFDVTEDYRRLKSLLIDFFRGPTVSNIRLAGLEYVLHFTALNGKIYFRSYKLLLKKSGCRTPRIELEEMGPSLDLVLRRTHLASDDLYKLSMKMPKALKPKKKKNISHDTFGTTYGRIHMQKQDLSKLQTRKMKGLKKRPAERKAEDEENKSKRIKKN
uniref:Ribosome production factor 2 homolog n=1 Tax=Bos taurus TaxID=9913 RepID=A0AAA9T549_BOVIN